MNRGVLNTPLVSVITVVLNGEDVLEKTIKSVLAQGAIEKEFIVIDGGSTDGTLEIIHRFEAGIEQFFTGQDKGIYDAMNKGVIHATGDWIIFMNAGDVFSESDVLEKVFAIGNLDDADIIYGDHIVNYGFGKKKRYAGSIDSLWKGSQFCHQSSFVRKSILIRHPYDLNFAITADHHFFYTAKTIGYRFVYVELFIAEISAGGVSDKKRITVIQSWRMSVKQLHGRLSFKQELFFVTSLFTTFLKLHFVSDFIKKIFYD